MAAAANLVPDWRDAQAYAPLPEADRSILAWEWLRRDPAYRKAAEAAVGASEGVTAGGLTPAERWGLVTFEPPHLAAPLARPIWRAHVHPRVLLAVGSSWADGGDAFDLAGLGTLATLAGDPGGSEHLLLSDGLRAIRLELIAGTFARGPVHLRYLLSGIAAAEKPLLSLRRLIALVRTGRFSRSLHPVEPRARRHVLMLRAYDAIAAGAGQREIAAILLSQRASEPRWRSSVPSLRTQAQRLVQSARRMAEGGYIELLR